MTLSICRVPTRRDPSPAPVLPMTPFTVRASTGEFLVLAETADVVVRVISARRRAGKCGPGPVEIKRWAMEPVEEAP